MGGFSLPFRFPPPDMDRRSLQSHVTKIFKQRGYTIHMDAVREIIRLIEESVNESGGDGSVEIVSRSLELILEGLASEALDSSIVTKETLLNVISKIEEDVKTMEGGADLSLTSSFEVPVWIYDEVRRNFTRAPGDEALLRGMNDGNQDGMTTGASARLKKPLLGAAEDKPKLFAERLKFVRSKILGHALFSQVGLSKHSRDKNAIELSSVASLMGRSDLCTVCAVLTKNERGHLYLEDEEHMVKVDLTDCRRTGGFFTEGCIVLAEGVLRDGVFHVQTLGQPLAETRAATLSRYPAVDFFANGRSAKDLPTFAPREERCRDATVVMLSEIHLDDRNVLGELHKVWQGYAAAPPETIILCGPFLSFSAGEGGVPLEALTEGFAALADSLVETPSLCSEATTWIVVPSSKDPGLNISLPRPPLPTPCLSALAAVVSRLEVTSNPARLHYLATDMVLFREDAFHSLRRNVLLPPVDDVLTSDPTTHLVKTLIDQASLSPLPLHIRPIYWNYDHALRLYPLPDIILLADSYEPYEVNYEGCLVANPGSFSAESSFLCVYPTQRRVDFCSVKS
jgi:DNA polymerase epsilon subunit 2